MRTYWYYLRILYIF